MSRRICQRLRPNSTCMPTVAFWSWFIGQCILSPRFFAAPPGPPLTESKVIQQFSSEGQVVGFLADGMVLSNGSYALQVHFVGATPRKPVAKASTRKAGVQDRAMPVLGKVQYENPWPGIRIEFRKPESGIVKSTYTVQAGIGRPEQIRLRYNVPIRVDTQGRLLLSLPSGELREDPPLAWQIVAGEKREVDVRFAIVGARELGFSTSRFDPKYDLVIDPLLSWNTFLGSTSDDRSKGIFVDQNGAVYVTGSALSAWDGIPRSAYSGGGDAFVVKYYADGNMNWFTFLGSTLADEGSRVLVDSQGNIYVIGKSYGTWGSPVFPHSGSGISNGFLVKLDSSGNRLWNTFMGGSMDVSALALGFGSTHETIFVAGECSASWGPYALMRNPPAGGIDTFVAKYESTYGVLGWTSFWGSTGTDHGGDMAVDAAGSLYLTGYSDATWGSPLNRYTAGNDAFVLKLNFDGYRQWNTFLGGKGEDSGSAIAFDSGRIFVAGSSNLTWGSPVNPHSGSGNSDGFLALLTAEGSRSWNTFFGGSSSQVESRSIVADGTGNVYLAGASSASWGSPLAAFNGGTDILLVKFDFFGAKRWHTFLGELGTDSGQGIFFNGTALFLTGYSYGSLFGWGSPIKPHSDTYSNDGFAAKVFVFPSITSLNPSSPIIAGGPNFTLKVNGSGFVNGSVIKWNGVDRSTIYSSSTQLTTAITAEEIAVGSIHSLHVYNPSPDDSLSNSVTFTVNNPTPELYGLEPSTVFAGNQGVTLKVMGAKFVRSSIVRCNGSPRTTRFESSTVLYADINTADLAVAGTLYITVFNPEPVGGLTSSLPLNVLVPNPTITSLNPMFIASGGPGFDLTVIGTGFVNGSVVKWNGSNRTTVFVSGTQLSASILASDIANPGTAQVTVSNVNLGGSTSSVYTFSIENPVPAISILNPASGMARGASFTLTVTGTKFVPGSTVKWNGAARTTTYISAAQLTSDIPATDIAAEGSATVTVFNPAPGGGTSAGATFTILAPGKKAWTLLLYLDGDNNLEHFLEMTIAGMEKQNINPDVNVVVQMDGDDSGDSRRFLVQKGGTYTKNLNYWELGEVNMGKTETLVEFVNGARTQFPADYYYLALADHGKGTEGVAWDTTSSSDKLTPAELREALNTLTSGGQSKIHVLHLDACLMGMFEVAYQVREYAEYMVASENLGWSVFAFDLYTPNQRTREKTVGVEAMPPLVYDRLLGQVSRTTGPRDLAIRVVENYFNHPKLLGHPRTISALDLSKGTTVCQALDAWADALRKNLSAVKGNIAERRQVVQKFDSRDYGTLDDEDEFVDLYDLVDQVGRVVSVQSVKNAGQILMDAILGMVVLEYHQSGIFSFQGETPGYWGLQGAHGMSLYFPPRSGTNTYSRYVNDQLFRMTLDNQWDEFLKDYFGAMNLGLDPATDPGLPPMLAPQQKLFLPLVLR